MSIQNTIRDIASQVSENYVICNDDMNDAILQKALEEELNKEVIKRICEQANQNVYLALFNDKGTDRSNITFDLADFNTIYDKIQESENAMNDYTKSPDDFRNQLELAVAEPVVVTEGIDTENEKIASLEQNVFDVDKYKKLLSKAEMIKSAELQNAYDRFSDIFRDTKRLVHEGESIADMAKIAMRYVREIGAEEGSMEKIAKAYDLIDEELKNNGYTVNDGFTKISSQTINHKSNLLKPVKEYVLSLSKVASLNTMIDTLKSRIGEYNAEITKIAKDINKLRNK